MKVKRKGKMMEKNGTEVSVSAVKRTMAVLELLTLHEELSVTEIAGLAGFHKSTVFRFLTTLVRLSYVYQNPKNEKYGLTRKLQGMVLSHPKQTNILDLSLEVMDHLATESGETVHLAILKDDHLTYIHKIESTQTLRVAAMSSSIGSAAPLYCTSLGKVLLASKEDDFIRSYMDSTAMTRHTDHTITEEEPFLREIQMIRENGYGVDNEENEEGVRCIGSPVYNEKGEAVAAISISGPSVRMTDARLEELSTLIKHAAASISERLGYPSVEKLDT